MKYIKGQVIEVGDPRATYSSGSIDLSEGRKDDQNKIRLDLLPFEVLEDVGKVLTHGAEKYAAHNWRKGMAWSRLVASSLRHISAFMQLEDKDPESGLPHLAHALCGLMFLASYQKLGRGTDDRWKGEEPQPEPELDRFPSGHEKIPGSEMKPNTGITHWTCKHCKEVLPQYEFDKFVWTQKCPVNYKGE